MPQPEPRRFLEAPLIDRISSRCRDLGPADQEMGLKVPNLLSIEGELPGSSQPRCRFYETPEHEVGPYGRLVNRALIMRIPAADLGRIAFERWRAHTDQGPQLLVGIETLRAMACGQRSYWDIPALLLDKGRLVEDELLFEGRVGVTTGRDRSFANGHLTLLFEFHSTSLPMVQLQIEERLEQVVRYLSHRGLTETLVAMCSEGQRLDDLVAQGTTQLPLPPSAARPQSFAHLLPESLRLRTKVHGKHPQLELRRHVTQLRIPTGLQSDGELAEILNESQLARELQESGFSISWVEGLADFMPRKVDDGEPQRIADLLPNFTGSIADLTTAKFGSGARSESMYWGPYLHIVADHGRSYDEQMHVRSGCLLLLYRFMDYLLGIEGL